MHQRCRMPAPVSPATTTATPATQANPATLADPATDEAGRAFA
ncbi:hypothetical protein ACPC54_29115 [Kitasatospora sp. NPDC094028]